MKLFVDGGCNGPVLLRVIDSSYGGKIEKFTELDLLLFYPPWLFLFYWAAEGYDWGGWGFCGGSFDYLIFCLLKYY